MARISAERVLADDVFAKAGIGFSEHMLAPQSAMRGSTALHIPVIDVPIIPGARLPGGKLTGSRKRGRPQKRGRPRKPRRGGCRDSAYMSRELRKETKAKSRLLMCAGYPYTVMATARPPIVMLDSEAKKHVTLQFSRLGQALERHGHSYIGLVVFEKKKGRLHGHLLAHVRPEQIGVVRAWADRYDNRRVEPYEGFESVPKHARPFVNSDINYVLKQHAHGGKFEAYSQFYEEGEAFRGTRVSFTTEANAVISLAEACATVLADRLAAKTKPPTLRIVVINPLVPEPLQLSMFSSCEKPISRLAQFGGGVIPPAVAQEVEARRRWRGLTQQELANAIMVARPTLANAMQGRFPLSAWAAARLREFLLPLPTTPPLRAA